MSELLRDLEGVETIKDDILVYARTNLEHDERLKKTLERIKQVGKKICEFSQSHGTCPQTPSTKQNW